MAQVVLVQALSLRSIDSRLPQEAGSMAMLRSSVRRGGGGGIIDKMIPGYQDKLWAALPRGVREYRVRAENDAFEAGIAAHQTWQGRLLHWKESEKSMAPSAKYRKPAVDW